MICYDPSSLNRKSETPDIDSLGQGRNEIDEVQDGVRSAYEYAMFPEALNAEIQMNEQAAFQDVFATATLAGLYFDQGAYREAAEIYKKLLMKNPSDLESKMRLEQALSSMKGEIIKSKSPVEAGQYDSTRAWRISYLETWLDRIQRDRRV